MADLAEVEWSNNLCIRLIQEYEKRGELWDPEHELFRVNSAKYDAWMELAQTFSCDIADVRKKLNSLFASHRREKAKVRNGSKSTWFLYPYMKFKRPGMDNDNDYIEATRYKKSPPKPIRQKELTDTDSEDVEADNQYVDNQEDDDEIPTIIIKQEPVTVHSTIDRPQKVFYMDQVKKPRLSRRVDKRRKIQRSIVKPQTESRERVEVTSVTSNLDQRLLQTLKLLRKSDLMKKKDDCDSFGEYIANSLRKHDDKTQSMIKQAINNILFEQEMKKYSDCAVVLAVEENPLILGHDK